MNPEYLSEGLILKLKLQCIGHLMGTTDIRKDPDAGKEWGMQENGETGIEIAGWHHHWMDMSLRKFWETVKGREAWHAKLHGVAKTQTWLSNNNNTQKQFG